MDWKCPECGLNNREDMAKCTCGYDANRPFRYGSQRAKETEGISSLKDNGKKRQTMNLKSFFLKLNGWQRVWVVFSVLCLLVVGVVVVNDFPDGTQYMKDQDIYSEQIARIKRLQQGGTPVAGQVKFAITWFIAWLGIIGVTYVGGIAVAWVIKGFHHNRSGGLRELASKYHNQFSDAMMAYEGHVLMKKKIVNILLQKFPDLHKMEGWLYPTDHCKNHTNKGACYCAETENAIFERLGRGKFRVLLAKRLP